MWGEGIWILNASVENNEKYQLGYNTIEFEILLQVLIIKGGEIETWANTCRQEEACFVYNIMPFNKYMLLLCMVAPRL